MTDTDTQPIATEPPCRLHPLAAAFTLPPRRHPPQRRVLKELAARAIVDAEVIAVGFYFVTIFLFDLARKTTLTIRTSRLPERFRPRDSSSREWP